MEILKINEKLNFFNTKDGVENFNLNGSATAVDIFLPSGEKIGVLVESQGATPKTYYSGNRVKTQTAIIIAEGFVATTVEVGGNSNVDAWEEASQKMTIFANPFGGGCRGIKIFRKTKTKNEFGFVFGREKILLVSLGEPKKATPEEFGRVCTSLDVYTNSSQQSVMYAGWNRPENLIEKGTHKVGFLDSIFGDNTEILERVYVQIPFAYVSEMGEAGAEDLAQQDVEAYFAEIYEYKKEEMFSVNIKYKKNIFIDEDIPDNKEEIPRYEAELLINSAKIEDIQEYLDGFDGEFCEESPKIREVGFRWMSESNISNIEKKDGTYIGAIKRNIKVINYRK